MGAKLRSEGVKKIVVIDLTIFIFRLMHNIKCRINDDPISKLGARSPGLTTKWFPPPSRP